jgi:hypothetical protein
MMIFAAYYSCHYWAIGRNLNLRPIMSTAIWRDLFRFEPILLVRYRWPQAVGLWPNKPGPPETPHKGCVGGVWAEAQVYSARFCSYSVASEQLQLF